MTEAFDKSATDAEFEKYGRSHYELCGVATPGGKKLVSAYAYQDDDVPPWYWAHLLVLKAIETLRNAGWTIEEPSQAMTTERTEVPTPERIEEIREVLDAIPPEDRDTEDVAIAELLAALDEAEKERDEAIAALRETLKTADEQRTELHRVENVARHKANADAYILAQAEKVIEAARKRDEGDGGDPDVADHSQCEPSECDIAAFRAELARWDERKR